MSKIAGSNLVVMWTLNEIGNIANIVFHKIFSFHTYSFGNGDYTEIIKETEKNSRSRKHKIYRKERNCHG